MANCKHVQPLTSTWDHEVHHETHGAGEEDDPDDPLHDVPAVLRDVLETVERGLGTVTLALLYQPRHLRLEQLTGEWRSVSILTSAVYLLA